MNITKDTPCTHRKKGLAGHIARIVHAPLPEDSLVVVRYNNGTSLVVGLDQFSQIFSIGE